MEYDIDMEEKQLQEWQQFDEERLINQSAKQILYKKCQEKEDGFLSGQVGWIVEAMEEYAKQEVLKALTEYKNYCAFNHALFMKLINPEEWLKKHKNAD